MLHTIHLARIGDILALLVFGVLAHGLPEICNREDRVSALEGRLKCLFFVDIGSDALNTCNRESESFKYWNGTVWMSSAFATYLSRSRP